ncbi:MAG: VWA domain-containing protein [Aeromicrobium sp.]
MTNQQLHYVLARFALGLGTRNHAASGDRLDLPAVVRSRVDARAGHAGDNVYIATERNSRDLGVLVLLDCSGSSTERVKSTGALVHEVQREAAAQLIQAWTELGERVACLGFHSRGRTNVHVYPVKKFDDSWGVAAISALRSLRPGAYTRLGTVIRHGVAVLAETAGTKRLLLVLVSDGHPYDEGYEGRYAAADVQRALEEAADKKIAVVAVSTARDHDARRETSLPSFRTVAHAGDASTFPMSFGRALSQALSRVQSSANLSTNDPSPRNNRRSDK